MDLIKPGILNQPVAFATIIFFMSILDEVLSRVARVLYMHGHNRYFTYLGLRNKPQMSNNVKRWAIRVSIPIMIVAIYIFAESSDQPEMTALYQAFAGFAFFNYLIINVRHVENILIYRLTMAEPENDDVPDIEGELAIGRRFSLKQSSFQIFALALLLIGVTIFHPTYFMLGGLIAPLLISMRNLILSGAVRTRIF